jgi:hypothetical protein
MLKFLGVQSCCIWDRLSQECSHRRLTVEDMINGLATVATAMPDSLVIQDEWVHPKYLSML